MKTFLSFLCFLNLLWTAHLGADPIKELGLPTLVLDEQALDRHEPIGQYLAMASDKEGVMTPEGILSGQFNKNFQTSGGKKTYSFGANRPWSHWVLAAVEWTGDKPQHVFLESGYVALDKVTVSLYSPTGELSSQETLGDIFPFSERPVRYRNPVFTLDLKPGLNYVLIHIQSTSMILLDLAFYDSFKFNNLKLIEMVNVGVMLGGVLMIFFYNLFLFLSTRDKNYGIYVLYVGCFFVYALGYYGILPYAAFSDKPHAPLSGWGLYILADLVTITACAFAMVFLNLKHTSPKFYRALLIIVCASGINMLIALATQGSIGLTKTLAVVFSLLMGPTLLAAGAWRAIKGYFPAVYFSIAWLFVIGGSTLVLMSMLGVMEKNALTTWSLLLGADLEMIFLSFALGARINMIKAEKLAAERAMLREAEEKKKLQAELISTQEENIRSLDARVREKTRDIREILTHINQGIFTFRSDLTIGEEHSDFLQDLLDDHKLAGKPLSEALFKKSSLSADAIGQTVTALEFSMGMDLQIAWEGNAHNLTKEFQIKTSEQNYTIEADWGPITDDQGNVEKVLVCLRDVTELRRLREQAASKDREMGMLIEILSTNLDKAKNFLSRTLETWNDIDQTLARYESQEENANRELFIHYHTIKGNARALAFRGISEQVHLLEDSLKALRPQASPEALAQLRQHSAETRNFVQRYQDIFQEKFARFLEASPAEKAPAVLFEEFFYKELQDSVDKVARELQKPTPEVFIDNRCGFALPNDESRDVITNIFNHLIRNSIDHGIESSEDRSKSQKSVHGRITIEIDAPTPQQVALRYSDDGRGLNLSRIYWRGREKGLVDETCTLAQLIDLIFLPNFSTAQKVSMISGRGVGMDAIRHYTETLGAKFQLVLDTSIGDEVLKQVKADPNREVFAQFHFEAIFQKSTQKDQYKAAG